ncbi:hypothetical protein LINPERHAP1_LOCUS37227 [Linum perenne]
MMVVVEIMTGTLFHVQVGDDATVADLKREIESQQKLPVDRMILLLGDDRLDDGLALAECGVEDGSHVYLFFNPVDDGSSHNFVFFWPEVFLS